MTKEQLQTIDEIVEEFPTLSPRDVSTVLTVKDQAAIRALRAAVDAAPKESPAVPLGIGREEFGKLLGELLSHVHFGGGMATALICRCFPPSPSEGTKPCPGSGSASASTASSAPPAP